MAKRYFLVFVGALGGLAGCGQAPETVTGSPGQVAQASLAAVQSPAPDRLLYVTDNTSNTASYITSYRLDAKGNVKPAGTLGGANTLLDGPNGIALDSTGELYVANTAANEILGFAPGANGNVAPNVIITNDALHQAGGLALDAGDNLYVADCGSYCPGSSGTDNVAVFPAGSNGNAAPSAVISGSNTQLDGVSSVALDARGNIYVTSRGSNAIVVFAPGSNGNVAPIDVISGSLTELDGPNGISVADDGEIYTGLNSQAIGVYHPIPYPNGNEPPIRYIQGGDTQLSNPDGVLALRPGGDLLVANRYANSIARFAKKADGDATPRNVLTGDLTQLEAPAFLAVSTAPSQRR